MKELTLTHLITDEKICLGYKKRGFGQRLWNGYGGKIEPGETIRGAAVREITEEAGVVTNEEDLELMALIDFHFENGDHLLVHTFVVRTWEGEPQETEEMRPQWFLYTEIPYEDMWGNDHYWLPRVLAGEKLRGQVWFGSDEHTVTKTDWKTVESF